jgi:hypothetical protein
VLRLYPLQGLTGPARPMAVVMPSLGRSRPLYADVAGMAEEVEKIKPMRIKEIKAELDVRQSLCSPEGDRAAMAVLTGAGSCVWIPGAGCAV